MKKELHPDELEEGKERAKTKARNKIRMFIVDLLLETGLSWDKRAANIMSGGPNSAKGLVSQFLYKKLRVETVRLLPPPSTADLLIPHSLWHSRRHHYQIFFFSRTCPARISLREV
jgi:hypothetical protein